jgi:hypothetical protein
LLKKALCTPLIVQIYEIPRERAKAWHVSGFLASTVAVVLYRFSHTARCTDYDTIEIIDTQQICKYTKKD